MHHCFFFISEIVNITSDLIRKYLEQLGGVLDAWKDQR